MTYKVHADFSYIKEKDVDNIYVAEIKRVLDLTKGKKIIVWGTANIASFLFWFTAFLCNSHNSPVYDKGNIFCSPRITWLLTAEISHFSKYFKHLLFLFTTMQCVQTDQIILTAKAMIVNIHPIAKWYFSSGTIIRLHMFKNRFSS